MTPVGKLVYLGDADERRCGHCKKLAPEYDSAAARLKGTLSLAKVDCTSNSATCNKFGVSGYPTLKIFRDGAESGSYDGPRTADGIVSTLKKQAGPPSVDLRSGEEFEKFIADKDPSVIGFFRDSYGPTHSEFLKAANSLRENYRFGHTDQDDLVNKYDSNGEGVVIFRPPRLTNKFEDATVSFPAHEKITSNKIKTFIQEHIFGLCPHMTEDNREQIQGKDLLVAYFDVDYDKNAKGSNYWRNRVMMVAKKFADAGKTTLNYAVADRKTFGHEVSELGLDASAGDLPVVGIKNSKGEKFVMQEEFTRDGKALERFLQDFFDGKLKRYLKSEPIPENNDGPVKVVVAENFDELVNDESKDVLIEFYAPWCGHCKNLEPKYKELGEKLAEDPNIVIAKMDATANDVPSSYEVRGFPTIFFSPAGSKSAPKKYEGGREVSDFGARLGEKHHQPIAAGHVAPPGERPSCTPPDAQRERTRGGGELGHIHELLGHIHELLGHIHLLGHISMNWGKSMSWGISHELGGVSMSWGQYP
uniref:Protein disulfide-isomerase n=1 Tax=Leptobrachium leishanense TaxID=445787 RepID=A0A8C5WGP5_9ANUR